MKFHALRLTGAYEIELAPHRDERGVFTRVLCMNELKGIGHNKCIVQVNHSNTRAAGTVRGMHFQNHPWAEIKIVTCLRGRVFDVMVDLRKGSPTFLQWQAVELSPENNRMVYIPEGFAHGFQTLRRNSELMYFHTEFYKPETEGGIRYDDEILGIAWPMQIRSVSQKDLSYVPIQREDYKGIAL